VSDRALDAYRAPLADDEESALVEDLPREGSGFYVVNPSHVAWFQLLTLGLYTHY
jgi:hypothetical protein